MRPWIKDMLIREVMDRDFVTAPADATGQDVLDAMCAEGSEYVVVVNANDDPVGAITQRRLLTALSGKVDSLRNVKAAQLASSPKPRIGPEMTAQKVARGMGKKEVPVVFVLSGVDLLGVVTIYDIMNSPELSFSKRQEDRRKQEWAGE